MENIRGRARVEAGELCLRKNGRGVDPNRNWDYHWGEKEKGEQRLAGQVAHAVLQGPCCRGLLPGAAPERLQRLHTTPKGLTWVRNVCQ